MIDVKTSFLGGLNQDTSLNVLPKDAYIDALNITRDAFGDGQDFSAVNIVGNTLVSYNWPEGTGLVVGAKNNELRNTIIFLRYNSNGYDGVYEYDNNTRTISKIFECLTDSDTNILNFNTIDKITSIDIYNRPEGDLLFFVDCLGRPTTLNIERFRNGEYTTVTRDIINVIKKPSLVPPRCSYGNDTAKRANNLRNKLFKFQCIWVYDDFEESVCSPVSAVPLPLNILDEEYTNEITNNNVITITLESGPKNVKSVKLLMSWSGGNNQWSDFVTVDNISKEDEAIGDDTIFSYDFYNDSVYPVYDVTRRIELFDYVPKYAKCQALLNGNVLAYGSITFGLPRELTPEVQIEVFTTPAGDGGSIGSLTATIGTPSILGIPVTFSGTPAEGTVINVKITEENTGTISTPVTYTTQAGDTAQDVADALITAISNVIFIVPSSTPNTIRIIVDNDYDFNTVEIVSPTGSATQNSIATFPFSTQRKLGIVYFDENGITNGVLYSADVVFPAYAENMSQQVLLPYINIEISHQPPIWAYSYQILLTKDESPFVYWYCVDVNTTETEYIYFEVTNMVTNATENPTVAAVLDWSFQDGDRVRVIRNMADDTVLGDTYDTGVLGILNDPTINGSEVTGRFIKIRNTPPFSTYANWGDNEFVLQLYRPTQQEATDDVLTYYELGQQYNILNPGTDQRYHAGSVQNQDASNPAEIDIYEGDVYFRLRTVYTSTTGQATYSVQDRNFVDFQISAVSSISGRPNVIDPNATETYFGNEIRYGEAYQPNTNINGLNRFPASSFKEVDYSYGDIMRMYVWDRMVRIFQKLKVGMMPLFSQIAKQANGDLVTVTTSELLNPIQYYQGNFGIGDAPESLVGYNDANYFCDTNRGIICRVSYNGVTPISILYKMNSWATQNLPLRKGEYKIFGVYEPRSNNYIISLQGALLSDAMTVGVEQIVNFSGSYLVSVDIEDACAATANTYYHGTPFGVGAIIYTDESLTTLLTGFNYIVYEDQIYNLNSATGVVGAAVADAICGIGVVGVYKLSVNIWEACSATNITLYTENAFGVSEIMYYDSSLTTPVTGFNYLVDVTSSNIYNLSDTTGEVESNTSSVCNTGIAGSYILGNVLNAVCGGTPVTRYTANPFGTGEILYVDSALTTPVTGFDYVVQVSTQMVYNLDDTTGEVLTDTTLSCNPGTSQWAVQNNATGSVTIDNVTPVNYTIGTGAFPLANSEAITGTHGGVGSEYTVAVTVSSGGPYSLNLYANGFLLETINVASTNNYTFGSYDLGATDDILITLTNP